MPPYIEHKLDDFLFAYTIRSMASVLLNLVRKKRRDTTQTPPNKAATLEGLPNELQLKIIELVFGNPGYTSPVPNSSTGDFYLSHLTLQNMRCAILGLVGTLPHLRSYFLDFVRAKVVVLKAQCLEVDEYTCPRGINLFLKEEVVTMKMLVAYLKTGNVRKLKLHVDEPLMIAMRAAKAVRSAFQVSRGS